MAWLPYIVVGGMLAIAGWLIYFNRRGNVDKRVRFYIGVSLVVHAVLIGYPLIAFTGCRHERPLGVPGGEGNSIAKGVPEGVVGATGTGSQQPQIVHPKMMITQKVMQREHQRETELQRLMREKAFLQLFHAQLNALKIRMPGQSSNEELESSVASGNGGDGNPLGQGLSSGTGSGNTAPGSPFGTRIGGTLWLYRIKYDSDSWDANWKGLPDLLQEVHHAFPALKVSDSQEVIKLSDLPRHSGEYMPTMLFITGTGGIATSEQDRTNLRSYILGGGMLVADNSGGEFEAAFEQFISQVLPEYHLREIERDHEIFQGAQMPYKMTDGCPVYRDHGAKHYARGIFDKDGRLMVFFSPGDMGSAWEVVELGKKRDTVEQAFHMGTNLVTYSLLTVHDTRKAAGK